MWPLTLIACHKKKEKQISNTKVKTKAFWTFFVKKKLRQKMSLTKINYRVKHITLNET